MKTKWYQKNWFVILMLLFVFPVGLFLMWYFKKWNKPARWIVTIVILLACVFAIFDNSEEKDNDIKTSEENKTSDKKEPTSKEDTKDDSKAKVNKEDKKIKEESKNKKDNNKKTTQGSMKSKQKEYVKTVKSYQAQIQIIGDDLVKLSNEIDDNNQITEDGKVILTSINTQLETATNTINDKSIKPPKKYKQDHEDLLYADELINEGVQGMLNNDNEGFDSMEVGVSIADDAIKNILEN